MPVITISREYGSLGDEIGQGVAEQLSLRFVDKEVVSSAAELAGVPEPELAEAYEKRPSFLERFVILGKAERYAGHMIQAIQRIAADGDVVLMGRGAQVLIEASPDVLHVRVVAPLDVRAERIAEAEGLEWLAALAKIRQEDRTRALLHEVMFGIEWDRPQLYDLVINTGSVSVEAAIQIVVASARAHAAHPAAERPAFQEDRHEVHEWGPFAPTTPW